MATRSRTEFRGGSAPPVVSAPPMATSAPLLHCALLLCALSACALLASCRSPAPPSSLAEARELARTAEDAGGDAAGDAAVARMLLWLTDSSAQREITYDSTARLHRADAERLRGELTASGYPSTCTVIERGPDAVLAVFGGMDSAVFSGGRCWLRCALGGGGCITGMELFAEEEPYDVRQRLLQAEQLLRDIIGGSPSEDAGRSHLRQLSQDDYPDLAALRLALREEFSAQASEQIIQSSGIFMRDGAVYCPDVPWRHPLQWEVTDMSVTTRSDRGFTAHASFPTEMQERSEVDIPLVITLDGWRLDAPLVK